MKYLLTLLLTAAAASAFAPAAASSGRSFFSTTTLASSTTDEATEAEISSILRPSYAIEPIPLRIGHGFDIHKMVPYEEAGQPRVGCGVTNARAGA